MSTQITTAFVSQFSANVFHLSQQKGSRLRGAVRVESVTGDKGFYDRIGSVTAQKKTSRHSDTPLTDTPHSRRMVTMSDYEHADLIDDADRVRLLLDPTSDYVLAFVMAMGRAMDDEIILAADAAASTGNDGSGSTAHPNTQKIGSVNAAATAEAPINVECLRRVKKLFDAADVDPSIRRYFGLNSTALENLLSETETTSSDFNTVKALVQGEINSFLGFEFIRTERFNSQSAALSYSFTDGTVGAGSGDANGHTKNLAWAKDGILLGLGKDITAKVSERDDKSYSTQAFASLSVGAVRMEEEKVVVAFGDE
jgi:hypothetical protein